MKMVATIATQQSPMDMIKPAGNSKICPSNNQNKVTKQSQLHGMKKMVTKLLT